MPSHEEVLAQALCHLDAAVASAAKEVKASLRPGAKPTALAKLAKVTGALPAQLEQWFAWHDGQKGSVSVGPSVNGYG